jgi:polyisoprenoid-binding protein YceI
MKPPWHLPLLALLVLFPGIIKAETYQIDESNSKISFKVRNVVGTVTGYFTSFRGVVIYVPDHLNESRCSAVIQIASIDTGIKERDAHLQAPDFFNVAKFPTITFQSASVRPTSDRSAEIEGQLTMHGVTRPVTLSVRLVEPATPGKDAVWQATTHLSRKSFGLSWNALIEASQAVGDDIQITLDIHGALKKS